MLYLEKIKETLTVDIKARCNENIMDKDKAQLLIELINSADTVEKAQAIAMLGTTYKRTGFHFEKRFAKMENTIRYLKKNNSLSFKTSTPPHSLTLNLLINS